ncbi:MAG: rRNA pseudouridine synthase [Candidatus Midichloria sp.]|nr:rRNA pseudouridine synthase [Candidatus Midichloria sp.]
MKYRLAKFISHSGYCSRRKAEELILSSRVSVNNEIIVNCATLVEPQDKVLIADQEISLINQPRLWIYNKPKGIITTHNDPQNRSTVFSQLPPNLPRVISIGRLDYNTEGLLLLTNSPILAHHLESSHLGLIRKYKCRIFGHLSASHIKQLAAGIVINKIKYRSIKVELLKKQGNNSWIMVSLTEGKNREIRAVMERFGFQVNRLIRLEYGKFCLNDLAKNSIIEVNPKLFEEYLISK